MKTKICPNCGEEKGLSMFYKKDKKTYYNICKYCKIEQYEKYYAYCKEERKKYYKNNQEKIKSQQRKYYINHKEKYKNIQQIYHKKCMENINDGYVSKCMRINIHILKQYPELIETKRLYLMIKRECKQK
jgi:hypothetical protein